MARVPRETIDRIRETADILDIVSEYVELRRRGRNFFGLCPFHAEKTPSFSVAPDKQIFHCFGCGIGGNVISFLMEYEKIEFVEAIQKLAGRYGIEVEFRQDEKSKEFFTHLYEIHRMAVDYYQQNLNSTAGEKVLRYLEDRGLTFDTVKQFSIGYAGTSWDALFSLAKAKKFPTDIVEKCGLFLRSEKGTFDRFRERIMFPIANLSGRVVAFGGRDFEGHSDAKYLNSPETPIYNKSELLFGLSMTKEAVRRERSIVVLEGYTDFLQLYQNGIRNIAATSGTALTEKHVNQIRKYADTAYLAFDGDDAGRKAAVRAAYNLLRGGVTPEIIEVPEGLDPDSWVKKEGKEAIAKSMASTAHVIEFHLKHTSLDILKPGDRSHLATEIVNEISGIRDEIIRTHTVKRAAELLEVEEAVLMRRLARRSRKVWADRETVRTAKEDTALLSSAERAQLEIVRLLTCGDIDTISLLTKHTRLEHFSQPVMKSLARHLMERIKKGKEIDLSGAVDCFKKSTERDLATKVLFEAAPHTDPFRVAVDCLIALERYPLKQSIAQRRVQLRELEKRGEDPSPTLMEVVNLQEQLKALDRKRTELLNFA